MKTKIKRHSRVVLSVALAVCMVVSCLVVGLIATNAAYVDGIIPSKNAADVTGGGTNGSKDDGDALGAKDDSEVGGANNAGGTSGCSIFLQSKNGSSYDVEYYNAYDKEITVNVADLKLDSNNLRFRVKAYPNGKNEWYGNQNHVDNPGAYTTLSNMGTSGESNSYGYFKNANNYTSITFKLAKDGNNLNMYWVSGASTSYTISYNSPSNGSFTTKPTSANSGASVSVVATPNEGYQINTVSVYKTGDSSTRVSATRNGNTITFTMPSYNVTVNVTFSICSYTITTSETHCTIAGAGSTATYNSTVNFTVTPDEDYALKSLTVKQGSTTINTTNTGGNAYTFTMPAGNVTITATCASTAGTAIFRFKSATAWVYQPYISINGGAETKMTLTDPVDYLDHYTNPKAVHPYSQTGSLRYAWYQANLTGIDTSKPVTITVRGQDTYMEATGTFTVGSGSELILACDNLMEGSTLVNLSSESDAVKDFYESPLHMVATAAEKAAINGS